MCGKRPPLPPPAGWVAPQHPHAQESRDSPLPTHARPLLAKKEKPLNAQKNPYSFMSKQLVYDMGRWLAISPDGEVEVITDQEVIQDLLEELRQAEEEFIFGLERSLGLRP